MDKILIFGIDSFTGGKLYNKFKKDGCEIYGTSYKHSKNTIYCNIADYKNVYDVIKSISPKVIYIFSGISNNTHYNLKSIIDINVFGPLNIYKSLSDINCFPEKIIIPSSASIYDSCKYIINESYYLKPTTYYGISKLLMEQKIIEYYNEFNTIITRPFNYFGYA